MSFADGAEFSSFYARDHFLPKVTPDAVSRALVDFGLSLKSGKDFDWLAMAVRRSLALTMRNADDGPARTSNATIRAELERFSDLASEAVEPLTKCNQAIDDALWSHASRHWNGEGGRDVGNGMVIGEPSEYRRYRNAVIELEWLTQFLRSAAETIEAPRKQWRAPEAKALRIQRGQCLAPVFKAAFGERVSANNFPSGTERGKTPFMDFYQRMVELAFGEHCTPNISEVLKLACRLHRDNPVTFTEGQIPGL